MRYSTFFAAAVALLAPIVISAAEEGLGESSGSRPRGVRVWKDIYGKEVIEGRFEDIVGDTVTLVHEGGLQRIIDISELSRSDQELINNIVRVRTLFLFFLLGAERVPTEVEETLVLAGLNPHTKQPETLHILRRKYEIEEAVPIVGTIEKLMGVLSEHLAGKTLRFSGRVINTERPRNSSQIRIDFHIEQPNLSSAGQWWNTVFRERLFLPVRLLEGDSAVKAGDTVVFEGRFALSIEACPKCKGTGTVRCPYCSGGVTRVTEMQYNMTPDGKGYAIPVGKRVTCGRCNGTGRLECDHYVKPQDWNPFDLTDRSRLVIGQLQFKKDLSHVLCFRLQDISVSFVSKSTGNSFRLSRPTPDAGIQLKSQKN